jgi:hypothetical protein
LADVRVGDNVSFAFLVLNTTLTNVGVENLPYFVITGLFNGESYNTTTDDLFVHQFTVLGEGIHTIDALMDEESVILSFNASKINTSSTIGVPDTVKVGKTINITGVATDEFGNVLGNMVIQVNVDGKTYTLKTDKDGKWALAYKPTYTGNVNVSLSWAGNNTHNGFTNNTNFNVKKGKITVTVTVTENPDGSVTIIANATDEDGSPVKNHPVDFFLNGEKVGSGITGENGIASVTLPANKISNGEHTITVIIDGGENYNNSTANIKFTKTNKNNETNNNPATANAVAMKKTGIPLIAIIFLLLSIFGNLAYRKRE